MLSLIILGKLSNSSYLKIVTGGEKYEIFMLICGIIIPYPIRKC